jgi:hypothetical protein
VTLARRQHPNPAREQWERTERWSARLQAAVRDGRAEDVEDFSLVVLHQCWSMHDWLVKALHTGSR